jgi:hypothetical protein
MRTLKVKACGKAHPHRHTPCKQAKHAFRRVRTWRAGGGAGKTASGHCPVGFLMYGVDAVNQSIHAIEM